MEHVYGRRGFVLRFSWRRCKTLTSCQRTAPFAKYSNSFVVGGRCICCGVLHRAMLTIFWATSSSLRTLKSHNLIDDEYLLASLLEPLAQHSSTTAFGCCSRLWLRWNRLGKTACHHGPLVRSRLWYRPLCDWGLHMDCNCSWVASTRLLFSHCLGDIGEIDKLPMSAHFCASVGASRST